VGRSLARGADEALPSTQFDAIAKEGTGRSTETATLPGNDVGRVPVFPNSRLPEKAILSNKLTPEDLPRVYGHEIGHVIDQLAGKIPVEDLTRELKALCNARLWPG
jgi:hypothetical protein